MYFLIILFTLHASRIVSDSLPKLKSKIPNVEDPCSRWVIHVHLMAYHGLWPLLSLPQCSESVWHGSSLVNCPVLYWRHIHMLKCMTSAGMTSSVSSLLLYFDAHGNWLYEVRLRHCEKSILCSPGFTALCRSWPVFSENKVGKIPQVFPMMNIQN